MRAEARGDYTASRGAATRSAAFRSNRARRRRFRAADDVCATCVGARVTTLLEGGPFRVARVDEATQIPIAGGHPARRRCRRARRRPAQLPPTVTSMDALHAGLAVSLFERMERLGLRLSWTGRPHARSAGGFPSASTFYGARSPRASDPAIRPLPLGRRGADGAPRRRRARDREELNAWSVRTSCCSWRWTAGAADAREGRRSARRPPRRARRWRRRRRAGGVRERRRVESNRESASDSSGSSRRTPRRPRRVRELGSTGPGLSRGDVRLETRPRASSGAPLGGLEVHSVDGFHRAGRRKLQVCCRTTRANDGGNLGFVRDDRRMNVAAGARRAGVDCAGEPRHLFGGPAADPTLAARVVGADRRARTCATRATFRRRRRSGPARARTTMRIVMTSFLKVEAEDEVFFFVDYRARAPVVRRRSTRDGRSWLYRPARASTGMHSHMRSCSRVPLPVHHHASSESASSNAQRDGSVVAPPARTAPSRGVSRLRRANARP